MEGGALCDGSITGGALGTMVIGVEVGMVSLRRRLLLGRLLRLGLLLLQLVVVG